MRNVKRMIAIIEDDPAEAQLLQDYFQRYAAEEGGEEFAIQWFSDGGSFLNGYQPIYDLVLMDIDLPGMNGLETAECLRSLDHSVVLIFVTNLARYAAKGYAVDAMDFMLKPVPYTTFAVTIQRALLRCRNNHWPDLLINISDGVYRISASRIRFIEVINHTLVYHTTEGDLTSSGNLKDVEDKLDSRQFVRCNRCYLVNLAFVRAVRGHTLVMDIDQLQISRPRRTAVLEALNNFLGGGV